MQVQRVFCNIVITLLALSLACCQTRVLDLGPPPPLPKAHPITRKIHVALVLGAGGARGMAHIGVLEVLEDAGVRVDLIVACSAGSIIGAFYADYMNARYLKKLFWGLKRNEVASISYLFNRFGLVQGVRFRNYLRKQLRSRYFKDLQIPLRIIATDLDYGELVTFGGGRVIPAIHASSAIPGIFAPVRYHKRTFVDGAVINPLPVNIAKQYDPEYIIAVDISPPIPRILPSHLFGVIKRSWEINYRNMIKYTARDADIVIKPDLKMTSSPLDDTITKESYEAGKAAAIRSIEAICTSGKHICKRYESFKKKYRRELKKL